MKLLIFLSILYIEGQTASYYFEKREEWENFKTKYNKTYETETEEEFRMKIYVENAYKVAHHNKLYAQGKVSYRKGINQFSDMLLQEFFETILTLKPETNETLSKMATFIPPANAEVPDNIDWREKGAVTPVKDQTTKCGSCYTFAATGALEGLHFRKTKKLVSLSEQNLVDCTRGGEYDNDGCDGGYVVQCFNYIKDNDGIDTEESYPYLARDDQKCKYNKTGKGATDKGAKRVPPDEKFLKAAVAVIGPIAVGIDASHDSFKEWTGTGVYYNPKCKNFTISHAVLVVGYGTTEDGTDYWLVKNSWGKGWGDEGYVKMARNKDNHCGITLQAVFPKV